MKCYLDSSVVLRKLFSQPHFLKEWGEIAEAFSSRLLVLECRRSIDRLRIRNFISPEEAAQRLSEFHEMIYHLGILPLTETVIQKAEQALTTPLSSLDSLHLSTALLWREREGDFLFATHDQELALAAKAHGFHVIGV